MKLEAVVMAAGLARRMGTNKLLLRLGDKFVYEHILDTLTQGNFSRVHVVSAYEEVLAGAEKRNFNPIYNDQNKAGRARSIVLATRAADEDSALAFFVADQPLLTLETIERLVKSFEATDLPTYPVYKNIKGNPVIFPKIYREGLLNLKEDQGGRVLLKNCLVNEVEINSPLELKDIDTRADYEDIIKVYGK